MKLPLVACLATVLAPAIASSQPTDLELTRSVTVEALGSGGVLGMLPGSTYIDHPEFGLGDDVLTTSGEFASVILMSVQSPDDWIRWTAYRVCGGSVLDEGCGLWAEMTAGRESTSTSDGQSRVHLPGGEYLVAVVASAGAVTTLSFEIEGTAAGASRISVDQMAGSTLRLSQDVLEGSRWLSLPESGRVEQPKVVPRGALLVAELLIDRSGGTDTQLTQESDVLCVEAEGLPDRCTTSAGTLGPGGRRSWRSFYVWPVEGHEGVVTSYRFSRPGLSHRATLTSFVIDPQAIKQSLTG